VDAGAISCQPRLLAFAFLFAGRPAQQWQCLRNLQADFQGLMTGERPDKKTAERPNRPGIHVGQFLQHVHHPHHHEPVAIACQACKPGDLFRIGPQSSKDLVRLGDRSTIAASEQRAQRARRIGR
jgi:hypothetical protein